VSDARRLKTLEGECTKLKKLPAEVMLDNIMLKGIASKMLTPAAPREAVAQLQVAHEVSGRRAQLRELACVQRVVRLPAAAYVAQA
jgi:hypothetical protein